MSGLAIDLKNPKPIIFYRALFAAGLAQGAGATALISVVMIPSLQSLVVFTMPAFFSLKPIARGYARLRRVLKATFATFLGIASLPLLSEPLKS